MSPPREPTDAELVAISREASASKMSVEIALEVLRTSETFRQLANAVAPLPQ